MSRDTRTDTAGSAPAPPGRRGFLAASAGVLAASAAGRAAVAQAAQPDAALIALCADHIANRDAYEADTDGPDADDDNPLWVAYCRSHDAIEAARPQTLAGLAAKARAAKAEAQMPRGVEMYEGTPAGRWAWDLVNDLLRLHGGAA